MESIQSVTGTKHYEEERQSKNTSRKTDHEKNRPKSNPKPETQ
jgi:hypothetical protein